MSAPTILRVKRRLEDNPQDALVITCKRIKTATKELSPSLFVFRGTVESQEPTHIKELVPHSDIKVQTAPNIKDIVEKLRKERKEASLKSHYEIVNYSRGLKDIDKEDQFNLVDLQKSDDTDDGIQYAYDVYIAAKHDFDISTVDNYVSIETDLVFDSYNAAGLNQSDDEGDDDDDSNDENNWRNDYPDSESSSIDEEDMIRAMERVDIGEELSSDEGEDKIYENANETFESNADLYGTDYAKYKAKVLKENPDLADGKGLILWADKDVESYKDDSDDGFYYGQEEDTEQFKEQYKSSSDEYSPD